MNNLGGEQQNVTQVGVNSTLSFGQAPFLRSLPFSAFELEYTPIVHWITPCVFVLALGFCEELSHRNVWDDVLAQHCFEFCFCKFLPRWKVTFTLLKETANCRISSTWEAVDGHRDGFIYGATLLPVFQLCSFYISSAIVFVVFKMSVFVSNIHTLFQMVVHNLFSARGVWFYIPCRFGSFHSSSIIVFYRYNI